MRELWVLYRCVLRQFSVFPTHICAHFARQITKDYKTFSMWLQNKDKAEIQNALCNFSESPHIFSSSGYMAWCIMQLVYFALYIHGLRSALVGVAGQAVLCGIGLYGHSRRESVSVFNGFVYL